MKKFIFIFALSCLFTLAGSEMAFAGAEHNLNGFAWSSGAGAISFNCTNDNSCATSNYGVNMNSDGTLVGYAWAPSVGWIQFGCPLGATCLSGFPTGFGTQGINAKVNGNNLQGWARVLSNGGGWDGWISFSGAGYGVNFSGTTFTGYAWGHDVIGWILFDIQNVYQPICPTPCGPRISGSATLDIKSGGAGGTSIVGNNAVTYNTSPTFVWTLTNVGGASCSVSKTSSGGTSFTTVSGIAGSGSTSGSALTGPSAYTYQINCTNPTISNQVGFTVAEQPPGFSLGGPGTANIQFLNSGTADSAPETFFVEAVGGFTADVALSVTSPCPASASYSFGGGSFRTSASAGATITGPYPKGTTFTARLAERITVPCDVTITGTGGGYSAIKIYTIVPVLFTPNFRER